MRIFSWLFRKKGYPEVLEEYQHKITALEQRITGHHRRLKTVFKPLYKTMVLIGFLVSVGLYLWLWHWGFVVVSIILHIVLTIFMRKTILLYVTRRIGSYEKQIQHYKTKQKETLDELKELTKFSQIQSLIERYEKPEKPAPKPDLAANIVQNGGRQPPRRVSSAQQLQQPQQHRPVAGASSSHSELGGNGQADAPSAPGVVVGESVQVLSKSTAWLNKLVDLAVGQNPNNCAALICQQCFAHNGLIMLEDWADNPIRFRCRACGFLNKPKQDSTTTHPEANTSASSSSTFLPSKASIVTPASTSSIDAVDHPESASTVDENNNNNAAPSNPQPTSSS